MRILYTTAQLFEVIDLPKRTVQNWVSTQVLIPSERATGTGSQNRFVLIELQIGALLTPLNALSIGTDALRRIAHELRMALLECAEFDAYDHPKHKEWITHALSDSREYFAPAVNSSGGGATGGHSYSQSQSISTAPIVKNYAWAALALKRAMMGKPALIEVYASRDEVYLAGRFYVDSRGIEIFVWGAPPANVDCDVALVVKLDCLRSAA